MSDEDVANDHVGQDEAPFWEAIANSTDPAEYRLYLDTFGHNARFAALARRRIASLERGGIARFLRDHLAAIGVITSVVVGGFTIASQLGWIGTTANGSAAGTASEVDAALAAQVAALQREVAQLKGLDQEQTATVARARSDRGIEAKRGKLWAVGSLVRFAFLDGSVQEHELVKAAFATWAAAANLDFEETDDAATAEVRVGFSAAGAWSYLGTDALAAAVDEPTINFGQGMLSGSPEQARRTALHEVGHVLGLSHEFQNPAAKGVFRRDKLIAYFTAAPHHWDEVQIDHNFLPVDDYPGQRAFDPDSIMNYEFPAEIFEPGMSTTPGTELSDSDRRYIAELYPQA